MGITVVSYLGPFARCKAERETVHEQHFGCLNQGCAKFHGGPAVRGPRHTEDEFCPRCGQPLGTYAVLRQQDQVRGWELAEALGGGLCYEDGGGFPDGVARGYHLYYPNEDRGCPRQCWLYPRDDTAFWDLTGDTQRQEVLWFEGAFAGELAALRDRYGAGEVAVRWGYLNMRH